MGSPGELYHQTLIDLLEDVWGEGFLSPGGPEEVARILDGHDLRPEIVGLVERGLAPFADGARRLRIAE